MPITLPRIGDPWEVRILDLPGAREGWTPEECRLVEQWLPRYFEEGWLPEPEEATERMQQLLLFEIVVRMRTMRDTERWQ